MNTTNCIPLRYLIVDGMLSGTGIRDAVEGGYLSPRELGLSSQLVRDISLWVSRYEDAHYAQFNDKQEIAILDAQGIALCKRLENELPSKVEYFSNGEMRKIPIVWSSSSKGWRLI
jgi:hypothetical protein